MSKLEFQHDEAAIIVDEFRYSVGYLVAEDNKIINASMFEYPKNVTAIYPHSGEFLLRGPDTFKIERVTHTLQYKERLLDYQVTVIMRKV